MRKLGIIGGMSWVSTALYYEHINRGIRNAKRGRHSAPLLIDSHDFEPLAAAQESGDWDSIAETMIASARLLEDAGCQGLIIGSNTKHKVYDSVDTAVDIPVLHIGEATAAAMQAEKISKAAIIGTRFTMTEPFMRDYFETHDIELSVPDPERMQEIDRIIYEELVKGEVRVESKRNLKTFLTDLAKDGNEAVVLGCTELVMLVNPDSNVLPIFDTTRLHAEAAIRWILGDD